MFNLNNTLNINTNNLNNPAFVANLTRLQGNTLRGHGRDFSAQIFLQFRQVNPNDPEDPVMVWIQNFATNQITSAMTQFNQSNARTNKDQATNVLFRTFMLTAQGYRQLGFSEDFLPTDESFRKGMNHPETQRKLGDNPANREEPFTGEIHAMILVACDDPDLLRIDVNNIVNSAAAKNMAILHVQEGDGKFTAPNRQAIEHFGYADGISQPLFTIPLGNGNPTDHSAPLSLALVKDRNAPTGATTPGEGFGTYVVYRKLEQNVEGFNQAVAQLAKRQQAAANLPQPNLDLAGAQVVGRFKDGTPLITAGVPQSLAIPSNNFEYRITDRAGNICPYQAHIRKTNPRGDIQNNLNAIVAAAAGFAGVFNSDLDPSLKNERTRRIARRGMTYQPQPDWRRYGTEGDQKGQPLEWRWQVNGYTWEKMEENKGLLFMCHQSNLAHQFEFMQQNWANNNDFAPRAGTPGQDGVIGQGTNPANRQRWPITLGNANRVDFDFGHFVTFKGGEYFFAPDIEFLKQISHVPKQRRGVLTSPITLFNSLSRSIRGVQTPRPTSA